MFVLQTKTYVRLQFFGLYSQLYDFINVHFSREKRQRRQRYKADIFYGVGDNNLEEIERHKITTRTENFEMVG